MHKNRFERVKENREVSYDKTSFPGRNFLSERRAQQSAKEARYPGRLLINIDRGIGEFSFSLSLSLAIPPPPSRPRFALLRIHKQRYVSGSKGGSRISPGSHRPWRNDALGIARALQFHRAGRVILYICALDFSEVV